MSRPLALLAVVISCCCTAPANALGLPAELPRLGFFDAQQDDSSQTTEVDNSVVSSSAFDGALDEVPDGGIAASAGEGGSRPVLGALLVASGQPEESASTDEELYGSPRTAAGWAPPNIVNAYAALHDGSDPDGAVLRAMTLLHSVHDEEDVVARDREKAEEISTVTASPELVVPRVSKSPSMSLEAVMQAMNGNSGTPSKETQSAHEAGASSPSADSSGLGETPVEVIPLDDSAPINNLIRWKDESELFWSNGTNSASRPGQSDAASASGSSAAVPLPRAQKEDGGPTLDAGPRQIFKRAVRRRADAAELAQLAASAEHRLKPSLKFVFERYRQRLKEIHEGVHSTAAPSLQGLGRDELGEDVLASVTELREHHYAEGLDRELQFYQQQTPSPVTAPPEEAAPEEPARPSLLERYNRFLQNKHVAPIQAQSVLNRYLERIEELKRERANPGSMVQGPSVGQSEQIVEQPKSEVLLSEPTPEDAGVIRVRALLRKGAAAERGARTRGAEMLRLYRQSIARMQQASQPTVPPHPHTNMVAFLALPKYKHDSLAPHRAVSNLQVASSPKRPALSMMERYRASLAASGYGMDGGESRMTQIYQQRMAEYAAQAAATPPPTTPAPVPTTVEPPILARARQMASQEEAALAAQNSKSDMLVQQGTAVMQAYRDGLQRQGLAGSSSNVAGLTNLELHGRTAEALSALEMQRRQIDALYSGKLREIMGDQNALATLRGSAAQGPAGMSTSSYVALEQFRHNRWLDQHASPSASAEQQ